jgi:hypothetical protein
MIATATRLVEGVLRPDDRVGRAIVEAVLVQLPRQGCRGDEGQQPLHGR